MSNSDFTVGKVVKAVRTNPDGSQENTIAVADPNGRLHPIANLDGHKKALERLAEDAAMDLNYAAFQLLNGKVFYIPIEDLNGVVKKLENSNSLYDLAGVTQIKNMLPIIRATDFRQEQSFVIF